MSVITAMRRQKAVYWAPGSSETAGLDFDGLGRRLFADPVEIDCRWEDRAEQYVAPSGETQVSRSVVYVDRDMVIGGVLAKGELSDMTDLSSPLLNPGAGSISGWSSIPNFPATEFLRIAYL